MSNVRYRAPGPVSHAKLLEVLRYEPDTGHFFWVEQTPRVSSRPLDRPAGGYDGKGYITIILEGRRYGASRLAWFYMTGAWPEKLVDHINCVRNDNRWCNLREANLRQNAGNSGVRPDNKSGYKGVSWHKKLSKWRAQINISGKLTHLGLFSTPEEASAAYLKAAQDHFGEFARAA